MSESQTMFDPDELCHTFPKESGKQSPTGTHHGVRYSEHALVFCCEKCLLRICDEALDDLGRARDEKLRKKQLLDLQREVKKVRLIDAEAHGHLPGPNVLVEEGNQFDEAEFDALRARFRAIPNTSRTERNAVRSDLRQFFGSLSETGCDHARFYCDFLVADRQYLKARRAARRWGVTDEHTDDHESDTADDDADIDTDTEDERGSVHSQPEELDSLPNNIFRIVRSFAVMIETERHSDRVRTERYDLTADTPNPTPFPEPAPEPDHPRPDPLPPSPYPPN